VKRWFDYISVGELVAHLLNQRLSEICVPVDVVIFVLLPIQVHFLPALLLTVAEEGQELMFESVAQLLQVLADDFMRLFDMISQVLILHTQLRKLFSFDVFLEPVKVEHVLLSFKDVVQQLNFFHTASADEQSQLREF
jgi:hypothetical protein